MTVDNRYNNWVDANKKATAGKPEGRPDFINMVAGELNRIATEDVAKLPEDIFVEVFMPLFAGEELKHPKESTIAGWISIAGTPYKEVDVFEKTTGKVLFRCPPLFDYNGINPVRKIDDRKNLPLSEVAVIAEKLRLIHPKQSEVYLVQELSKRSILVNSGARLAQNVLRWNEVFKRYDRPPMFEVNSNAAPSSSVEQPPSQQQKPATEAEYEDF